MDGLAQDRRLLQQLVEYTGLDGAKIARRIGVAASTIGRPLSGAAKTRLSQRTLEKLREEFPDFPRWSRALQSVSDKQVPFTHAPASDPSGTDSLAIPMLELGYGMGGTFLDDIDPGEVVKSFPREFIRIFTRAPADQLCFSYGIGDSMEPTIHDRDVLLIDLSRKDIRISEQIWVLSSSGIGMVKRVRVEGGRIILCSDKPQIAPYEPGDDEIQVIGRVVAVVKST